MNLPRTPLIAALVLCGAAFATGLFLTVDNPEPEPQSEPQQTFDREIAAAYVEAGCWTCHTVSTLGDEMRKAFGEHAPGARHAGPDLAGAGARYHRDWHVAHFWNPQDVVADSQMPAQRHLFKPGATPPELNQQGVDVVKFMLALTKPSTINKPWPTEPAPVPGGFRVAGQELFLRECAGCHGNEGRGDGPAARFFVATRKPLNFRKEGLLRTYGFERPEDAIYTTITNGVPGTGMPGFGNRLNDQQRADIAAFVASLARME